MATELFGGGSDGFWFRVSAQPLDFSRFRNVPVLAELAAKIATGRTEGEHGCAWQEVIERFLFDWIDTKAVLLP